MNDSDDDAIARFKAVIIKCVYNTALCVGVSSTESEGNANSGIDPIGVFLVTTDDDNDDELNESSIDVNDDSFSINLDDNDIGFLILLFTKLL